MALRAFWHSTVDMSLTGTGIQYTNMDMIISSWSDAPCTLCSEKIPTYVFDYNSGISWSIFLLFIPVETGINPLQYTAKHHTKT